MREMKGYYYTKKVKQTVTNMVQTYLEV